MFAPNKIRTTLERLTPNADDGRQVRDDIGLPFRLQQEAVLPLEIKQHNVADTAEKHRAAYGQVGQLTVHNQRVAKGKADQRQQIPAAGLSVIPVGGGEDAVDGAPV